MEITPDAGGLHGDILEGMRGAVSVHIFGAEDLDGEGQERVIKRVVHGIREAVFVYGDSD